MGILDLDAYEGKLEIYIANSAEEVGQLAGTRYKFEGLSIAGTEMCISLFPFGVFHEIVHLLMEKRYGHGMIIEPPGMLHHGFMEYGGGNGGLFKRHLSSYHMRKKLEVEGNISLAEIIGYPGSTSFTKHLIEEWGNKKYRELLFSIRQKPQNLIGSIESVYQINFNAFEQEWINWIKRNHETDRESIFDKIEFKIIVNTFDRKKTGRFTIYCDSKAFDRNKLAAFHSI